MKYLNLIILGVAVLILSIVFGIATLNVTGKYRFKKTALEMLEIVTRESHSVSIKEALAMSKSNDILFIDIRTPKQYDGYRVENAINIPYERILDDAYVSVLESSQPKVLYGNSSVEANAAWMILTQFGYRNLQVLDASADDWMRHAQIKDIFKEDVKNDEMALFDYESIMNGSGN